MDNCSQTNEETRQIRMLSSLQVDHKTSETMNSPRIRCLHRCVTAFCWNISFVSTTTLISTKIITVRLICKIGLVSNLPYYLHNCSKNSDDCVGSLWVSSACTAKEGSPVGPLSLSPSGNQSLLNPMCWHFSLSFTPTDIYPAWGAQDDTVWGGFVGAAGCLLALSLCSEPLKQPLGKRTWLFWGISCRNSGLFRFALSSRVWNLICSQKTVHPDFQLC